MSEATYRLVTRTRRDGSKPESHLSEIPLTQREVLDQLAAEVAAHKDAGWAVTVVPGCAKFEKPNTVRVVRAVKA